MTDIKLVKVSSDYKNEIMNFKKEFMDSSENTIPGGELLDKIDNIDEWLEYVIKNSNSSTVSKDWITTDTYLAFESGHPVGIICLRHELNDFLNDFGHIGYSVRPSQRKKGYATKMLGLILERARQIGLDEVKLSSMHDNKASIKTILKNKGQYESSYDYLGSKVDLFIIKL